MEIKKIKTKSLRKEEHFEFNKEVKDLIEMDTPAALGIESKYPAYVASYQNEEKVIYLIRNNPFTIIMETDDRNRDVVISGLRGKIKSDLNHFVEEKREAAERLMRVIDHYGNITIESYDEETVDTRGMIKEFRGEYAADIVLLGYTEWIDEVERLNNVFVATVKLRDEYNADKTSLRLVDVRKDVDTNLSKIFKAIDVLADLNPSDLYTEFITQVNVRIDKYNNKIAIRKGRNSADDDEPETAS